MESLQSFTSLLANALSQQQPNNSLLNWDFRGEVADMVEYDNTLIGIVSFSTSTEEVYGNRTQRMEGSLTGQILIEQMTNADVLLCLNQLQTIIYDYIAGLRYTELGDAVIIQGTCDSILTE